jgi:hypothetical protein
MNSKNPQRPLLSGPELIVHITTLRRLARRRNAAFHRARKGVAIEPRRLAA